MKKGNSIYLAVWNLGGETPVTVTLENRIKAVKIGYPKKIPTDFTANGNVLTVRCPCEYSARFFEIEI